VTGGETLGADLTRHAQEWLKLYIGVAIGAGNGCATGEVVVDEGTHHASLEVLLEVHHVMRKMQMLCHGLGVIDVIEGAATVLRGAIALKFGEAALVPELHGQADDGVALLLQEGSNGRRVDAAGHGYGDEAALSLGASGESVELGHCAHANSIISSKLSGCLRGDGRGAAGCALTKTGPN